VALNGWMDTEPYASAIGGAMIEVIGAADTPTNDVSSQIDG